MAKEQATAVAAEAAKEDAAAAPPPDPGPPPPNGTNVLESAAQILGLADLKVEQVWCDAWQRYVYMKAWDGDARDAYERIMFGRTDRHMRATIVAWSLVNERGERIFKEEQIPELSRKSGRALDELALHAQKTNVIGKQVEEAEKNSSGARSADST